ncbi:MAG: RNA polymerase factor sigma-32 [Acidobacteriota bacterium]
MKTSSTTEDEELAEARGSGVQGPGSAKPVDVASEPTVEPEVPPVSPEESLQLAKLDPLRKYLIEISRFGQLASDEEHRLAVRYREEDDQKAAYRLITSNLRLVVRIARLYNRVYDNIMDLIQEGNIGLLEAVKRFDPYKGTRLPTYASWWIKAYILKFLIDNFRIVRVGTTNERRRLLFNLRKEKEKLRLQGIEPTPQLIAERLNVSVEDVREIEQNIEAGDVSLDSPVDGSGSTRYSDTLETAEDLIDEKLARGELKRIFNQKIKEFSTTLTDRENVILRERLISEEPKTLQEIAGRFGVTREAIRLSEKALVSKIKIHMHEALKGITRVEIGLLH